MCALFGWNHSIARAAESSPRGGACAGGGGAGGALGPMHANVIGNGSASGCEGSPYGQHG